MKSGLAVKPGLFLTYILCALVISTTAHAYRMPAYRIAEGDWVRPAEVVFAAYDAKRNAAVEVISISGIENYRRCHNCRLSKREQQAYRDYRAVEVPHKFWDYVVRLKCDLVVLGGGASAEKEADLLAKRIIQKIYDLSNEYDIVGSALVHNSLINMKMRKKGFCYHYTDALRKELQRYPWKRYAFHWGAAWNETWRENNGLVITAKGKPFETGIVVDPWRVASKPYWHAVEGDRFPWKELHDVIIVNE